MSRPMPLAGGWFVWLLVLCLVAPFGAFAQTEPVDRNKARPYFEPPRETVVTSFSAVQSWTASLLAGVREPAALFYGNADLHSAELLPEQVAQLARAEALILFGGHADEFIQPLFEKNRRKNAPVITLMTEEDFAGRDQHDHLWLDFEISRKAVDRLAEELVKLYPNRAEKIRENLEAYKLQLSSVQQEAAKLLEPYRGAEVLASHPGTAPGVEQFGITVKGYFMRTHGREPSVGDIAKFRDLAVSMGNPVVMRSPGELPAGLARMATEVPMRFAQFDPVESGEPKANHFVNQMRQNALNLALALRAQRQFGASFTPAPTKVPGEETATSENPDGDEANPEP